MKKKKLILIGLFLLALGLRLWQLNLLPTGISHVELDYVINAKAIWLSGKDISQSWTPWSLKALDSKEILAELSSLLWAPFMGIPSFSLLAARLPNALLHSLGVLIIFGLTKQLIDYRTGLMAAGLYAVNPWTLHFGRTAYEVSIALILILGYLLVLLKQRGWKIFWAWPFLCLSFFTYHGYKFLFLPLAVVSLAFSYWRNKKELRKSKETAKPYVAFFTLCLSVALIFLLSFSQQSAKFRSRELVFMNLDRVATEVNQERLKAIPSQFLSVFNNKLVFIVKDLGTRYLGAFSVPYWFIHGDLTGVGGHTFWNHGYFYYLDLVLAIVGFLFLFKKKRAIWIFLTSLLLIAPIPAAVNVTSWSYVHRAALMVPIMIIFMGYGAIVSLDYLKRCRVVVAVLGGVYLILIANFLYLYVFRYPIYNSEAFFLSKRVLAEYLIRVKQEKPELEIVVVIDEPMAGFEQYLFYADEYSQDSLEEIGETIRTKKFRYKNIRFTNDCLPIEALDKENSLIVLHYNVYCGSSQENLYPDHPLVKERKLLPLEIASVADGGTIFRIYHDSLCSKYRLPDYPRITALNDLAIDKQNNEAFCQKWISK